ncbi:hypothetical protein WJX73_008623 [Symbiochloris irregularis]|uniref:Guanylate-binding protein N-terminal domain-containing protein n=1 Tax=Symbiochloris irregularis TaxID=706552 RepID=A0AAW1NU42_9CHLO
MLLVLSWDAGTWAFEALSLDEAADPPLFKVLKERQAVPDLADLPQDACFHVGMVGSNCYLMAYCSDSSDVKAVHLTLSSRATTNVLTGQADDEPEGMTADTPAHALLSYFYHIFEKYAGRAALGNTITPTQVHFLLPRNAAPACPQALLDYAELLWEGLQEATKKDLRGVVFNFHAQLGWQLPKMQRDSIMPLGAWVLKAIECVPIQLCRVEGGQLQPMSDGKRMPVTPGIDSMEELAGCISFGLYNSVLEAATQPVLVCSSMGAQSTGKSYQLNHLGGTLFGVSGRRCTDGILMTVRSVMVEVKEVNIVFLDCEGMNSWERLEIEDQLLALFSAALSSLTLLKTQFTFDRYVSQMLLRFNLGASKVISMCSSKSQAQRMVQQDDNFLATMYSGEYSLADFPCHQSRGFFRKLEKVAAKLAAIDPHFKSGREFGQVARMLLAKLSNSDWTPLDPDQIRSRVALLQSNLGTACHNGNLSGRLEEDAAAAEAAQLLNMDTQLPLAFDDVLTFPVCLLEGADTVDSSVQLKPLAPGADPSPASTILGIANFEASVILPDHALPLGSEDAGTGAINHVGQDLAKLRATFCDLFGQAPRTHQDFSTWYGSLRAFLKAVVERRSQHVDLWLRTNMASFLEDPEALAIQVIGCLIVNVNQSAARLLFS